MGVLDHSYQFARMFNEDKDLRTGLWKVGTCVGAFSLAILRGRLNRFHETSSQPTQAGVKQRIDLGARSVENVLRPQTCTSSGTPADCRASHAVSCFALCVYMIDSDLTHSCHSLGRGVLQDYSKLRSDTQAKNIAAWTPVVAEILDGFCRFDDKLVSLVSS